MTIVITAEDPGAPDAELMLEALSQSLAALTGSSGKASFDPDGVREKGGLFVIARDLAGKPLGCGAYRALAPEIAELKRMYAVFESKGVGKALLDFLEGSARADGYRELWLETRRVNARAIAFYRRNGYAPIDNYGRYAGRSDAVCFAKSLA